MSQGVESTFATQPVEDVSSPKGESSLQNLLAKEQVLYDIHAALGIKWDDDPCFRIRKLKGESIEKVALDLFRLVHGTGDSGSSFAFHSQNPCLIEGWWKLAKKFLSVHQETGDTEK